jgi:NADH-ubiquinone oxidoreductase chain 1
MRLFTIHQEGVWFLLINFPLACAWFGSCLAETNRTPFDFAEGESELVSGFNVEYSSGGFALIFIAEYARILFMSILFSLMFIGALIGSYIFLVQLAFMAFAFI